MNALHRGRWAGMAFLAAAALTLAAVCGLGVSRAEAPQPPDIWEVQGEWVHVTGIKLTFTIDGTYEMIIPVPFTDMVLLRDHGMYDVAEGVIFAESFTGGHFRMSFRPIGLDEAIFRFFRNDEPAGELVLTHMR